MPSKLIALTQHLDFHIIGRIDYFGMTKRSPCSFHPSKEKEKKGTLTVLDP